MNIYQITKAYDNTLIMQIGTTDKGIASSVFQKCISVLVAFSCLFLMVDQGYAVEEDGIKVQLFTSKNMEKNQNAILIEPQEIYSKGKTEVANTNVVPYEGFSVCGIMKKAVILLTIMAPRVNARGLYITPDKNSFSIEESQIIDSIRYKKSLARYEIFNNKLPYIEQNPVQWFANCMENIKVESSKTVPDQQVCSYDLKSYGYNFDNGQEQCPQDYFLEFRTLNCRGVSIDILWTSSGQDLIVNKENAIAWYTFVKRFYEDEKELYPMGFIKAFEKNESPKVPTDELSIQ